LNNVVGPLISPPTGNLLRALTTLEHGESWLVEPLKINEGTYTPGIRKDVKPNSWFHLTECFGPVLGLMRANDLTHALQFQNATEYGLTGGIQSLDPSEIEYWLANAQVGNAYVNRHITGAIVERQPFGGWKKSSIGPGSKPGGPNHLSGYGNWTDQNIDVHQGIADYSTQWNEYFTKEHDAAGLRSEANILRYFPADKLIYYGQPRRSPVFPWKFRLTVTNQKLPLATECNNRVARFVYGYSRRQLLTYMNLQTRLAPQLTLLLSPEVGDLN
jgi:RHH-type proline utilization regulon transcriptional repressor/proline dehydrogenase/delta 1-pyrroline-5-carboxylate dehydrogenase